MNNKKGGIGAKLLIVLILMIASAVAGAYGYRVLDGKLAVRDAQKTIDSIKLSEYDTAEASQLREYIEDVTKNLETATTRKEVYKIMEDFLADADKVKTKTEKELEEARRAAEEAKNTNADSSGGSSDDSNSSGDILNGLFGKKNSSKSSDDDSENASDGSDIFN